MVNSDERYTLDGMNELDEGSFTIRSFEIEQEKGIRGYRVVWKSNLEIMA